MLNECILEVVSYFAVQPRTKNADIILASYLVLANTHRHDMLWVWVSLSLW